MTEDELDTLLDSAQEYAYQQALLYFNDTLGGVDKFACGFAWVYITEYNGVKITGRTKMGRLLAACGVRQDYSRKFMVWSPSKFPCQNIDTLEQGAVAYRNYLTSHGFTCEVHSRLD